jgi:predicted O-linked N-acetylglucosamine transferase (SPINDLY family)
MDATLAARAERYRQAGLTASRAGLWAQAAQEFERATRLMPADALMWMNLSRAQLALGEPVAATKAARRAYEAEPGSALACRMLADCLLKENRPVEAAAAFDGYPATAPRDFDWHSECGVAMFYAKRYQDAVGAYFQALALRIEAALVHYRLGLAFKELGLKRESVECFRTTVALNDHAVNPLALSHMIQEQRQICDWRHVEADTAQLLARVDAAEPADSTLLSPFVFLALDATPGQLKRVGELRTRALARGIRPLPPAGTRRPGRIRVGYLSGDFHHHATSMLMAELLERRDRDRFEVYLYSHGEDDDSVLSSRVRAACDQFVDISHMTNADAARRLRDDGIDIAIDLKGHTRGSRFELLAYRPAPIQVTYLGYPATTGAEFIDYIIGDEIVTPLAHAPNYSEHIAQLPHSYQPNDRRRPLPPVPPRAGLGLPEDAVVLCCFNQTYKMSPAMLDLWARILDGAPNAVLWLLAWNPDVQTNLGAELARRGVSPQRVVWAPTLPLDEHIARFRAADLFLDTWPCNAHTTASEALWAGVPVLTVPGPTFASRVAASLIHACGLGELACDDADTYVAMACRLANERGTLASAKHHLEQQRLQLPLFDTERYARDYEALLQRMFDCCEAGLKPAPIATSAAMVAEASKAKGSTMEDA